MYRCNGVDGWVFGFGLDLVTIKIFLKKLQPGSKKLTLRKIKKLQPGSKKLTLWKYWLCEKNWLWKNFKKMVDGYKGRWQNICPTNIELVS